MRNAFWIRNNRLLFGGLSFTSKSMNLNRGSVMIDRISVNVDVVTWRVLGIWNDRLENWVIDVDLVVAVGLFDESLIWIGLFVRSRLRDHYVVIISVRARRRPRWVSWNASFCDLPSSLLLLSSHLYHSELEWSSSSSDPPPPFSPTPDPPLLHFFTSFPALFYLFSVWKIAERCTIDVTPPSLPSVTTRIEIITIILNY